MNDPIKDRSTAAILLAIQSALLALVESHPDPKRLHAASRRQCASMLVFLESQGAEEKFLHAYADFYRSIFPKARAWLPETPISRAAAEIDRHRKDAGGAMH